MASCCPLSLLGHSVPFSLLHVSLLCVIGAHSFFLETSPEATCRCFPSAAWAESPSLIQNSQNDKEKNSIFSRALMKLLENWGYMIKFSPMTVTGPQLHQQNLFLCGLLFARLWHFHLEYELILSRAKSPLSLGRMLGLRPSQDPGAVRPNPIPMWWWVSLP